MARDMYNLYAHRTTEELLKLRSKKVVKMQTSHSFGSYFSTRDLETLKQTIAAIDVELARRAAQPILL